MPASIVANGFVAWQSARAEAGTPISGSPCALSLPSWATTTDALSLDYRPSAASCLAPKPCPILNLPNSPTNICCYRFVIWHSSRTAAAGDWWTTATWAARSWAVSTRACSNSTPLWNSPRASSPSAQLPEISARPLAPTTRLTRSCSACWTGSRSGC